MGELIFEPQSWGDKIKVLTALKYLCNKEEVELVYLHYLNKCNIANHNKPEISLRMNGLRRIFEFFLK